MLGTSFWELSLESFIGVEPWNQGSTEVYDLERSWIILLGCEDYSLSPFGQNSWKPFGWWNYYTKWISFEEEGLGLWKDPDIKQVVSASHQWLWSHWLQHPKFEPHPVGKIRKICPRIFVFFFSLGKMDFDPPPPQKKKKNPFNIFVPPIFPSLFCNSWEGDTDCQVLCLCLPWSSLKADPSLLEAVFFWWANPSLLGFR